MSLAGADPGLPRVSLPQAAIASWLGLAGPALGHWGRPTRGSLTSPSYLVRNRMLAEASGASCTARRYWTPRPHHMTRSWPRQLGASHPKSSAPEQSSLSQGPFPCQLLGPTPGSKL